MLSKESVLRVVREQGPTLPIQIKKVLGGDTLLIGAILSELLATKEILVSKTRFGSSPAYYTTGQEKGFSRLSLYLTPEQRKTLQILQQKKVLEDKKQTLESRIALRQLPDFCIPTPMKGKLFWRWHETTEGLPKPRLKPKKKTVKKIHPKRKPSRKPRRKKRL